MLCDSHSHPNTRHATRRVNWRERATEDLNNYPLVARLLGDWIAQRASEPDGLMNNLVRSACGGSAHATLWETRLRCLPRDSLKPRTFRQRFQLPDPRKKLGLAFDDLLDDRWAELTAIHAFASTSIPVTIAFPKLGVGRTPDFEMSWPGMSVSVEVKRVRGLARELRWVYSALEAARLLFPDVGRPAIDIWAPDAHHLSRLGGATSTSDQNTLRADVARLLDRDVYVHTIAQLTAGCDVVVSHGVLMLSPNSEGGAISVRPFATNADSGLANAMGSLKGVADVMLRIRSALEQLFSAGEKGDANQYLIAYIYFDAWELRGLKLAALKDAFSDILQWNPRIALVITDDGDHHVFFGRNSKGIMGAETHFKRWTDYLSS
jgi:hypothetical protein